ncbi:hypothetical protein MLD38_026539 [Melastoma candidum]|uniref:Uncharacterized protein n=1 Tax=Melastoma candidum TaxID=119954 RepID=A0ACB9P1S6_9MYRT|nr:hypothetical protein MLD38_026539 [Melastoma candidum]
MEAPPERFRLFEELQLQELPGKFVIRSKESPIQGFSVDRCSGDILSPLVGEDEDVPADNCRTSIIYGVVGTIRLLAGTYVLVITSRKEVGTLFGFPIYRVTSMRFLCCNEAVNLSTPQEKKYEAYFMALLKVIESTPGLYYSYETDITLNMQRRFQLADGWMRKPPWKQADPRFVWNKNLLEELIELKLDKFILPLLQGNILKLL